MKADVVLCEILRHCAKAILFLFLSSFVVPATPRRPVTRAVLPLLSNRAPLPDSQSRAAGRAAPAVICHVRSHRADRARSPAGAALRCVASRRGVAWRSRTRARAFTKHSHSLRHDEVVPFHRISFSPLAPSAPSVAVDLTACYNLKIWKCPIPRQLQAAIDPSAYALDTRAP